MYVGVISNAGVRKAQRDTMLSRADTLQTHCRHTLQTHYRHTADTIHINADTLETHYRAMQTPCRHTADTLQTHWRHKYRTMQTHCSATCTPANRTSIYNKHIIYVCIYIYIRRATFYTINISDMYVCMYI